MTRTRIDYETATHAYSCEQCGHTTLLSYAGGDLNCTCDPSDPAKVHLTLVYVDGEHEYRGTIASITGITEAAQPHWHDDALPVEAPHG